MRPISTPRPGAHVAGFVAIAVLVLGGVAIFAAAAVLAAQAENTGISDGERPRLMVVISVLAISALGWVAVLIGVWTDHLPYWLRNRAWLRDAHQFSIRVLLDNAGKLTTVRIGVGIVLNGLIPVAGAAFLQGLLVGWLLNSRPVLSVAEATIATIECVCAPILVVIVLGTRGSR